MPLLSFYKYTFALFLALSFFSNPTNASHPPQSSHLMAFQFEHNPASLNRITAAQQQAVESGKQLLVVLGADWCSDSTALAQHFSQPEFYKQLTDKYEVISANAGFFEHGFDIAHHFNLPMYYGTPTVLIIDPAQSEVLNRHSFHIWANAANIRSDEYQRYFFNTHHQPRSHRSHAELAKIDAVEKELAIRVQNGYGIVGPLLASYIASNKPPSESFQKHWAELSQFRNQVAKDLAALRTSQSPLQWPVYPPLSWES